MTSASLLLVLLSSFLHARWNLLAKRAAGIGPVFVFAYNLFSCAVYLPWALYLIATGAMRWSGPGVACMGASALIHLAYSLCLQRGYRAADLSVVYPVARGTGPMLATIGAILLLGEMPTGRGIFGLAAVVAGIGLIATQGDLAAFRRPAAHAGVRWGGATGGLIACYTLVDGYAVKTAGVVPVLLDWFSNLARFLLLLPLVLADPRRALAAMRGYWWVAFGVGAMSPLAYILVLAALRDGAPLHIVAPMREMSMMIGALMGMAILREPVGPWRLGGCGLLVLGVALLSTA